MNESYFRLFLLCFAAFFLIVVFIIFFINEGKIKKI